MQNVDSNKRSPPPSQALKLALQTSILRSKSKGICLTKFLCLGEHRKNDKSERFPGPMRRIMTSQGLERKGARSDQTRQHFSFLSSSSSASTYLHNCHLSLLFVSTYVPGQYSMDEGCKQKNGEMHRRDFPSKADFSFFHPSFPSYSSHFS